MRAYVLRNMLEMEITAKALQAFYSDTNNVGKERTLALKVHHSLIRRLLECNYYNGFYK